MHFHLPKPLHGWREFAGEVGIIVIGVLIALGAEQVLERWHDHERVDRAIEALRVETRDHDFASAEIEMATPCILAQIDAVAAKLTSGDGAPLTRFFDVSNRSGFVIRIPQRAYADATWQSVNSGDTLRRLDPMRADDLASYYGQLRIQQVNSRSARDRVATLNALSGMMPRSEDGRLRFLEQVEHLRSDIADMDLNAGQMRNELAHADLIGPPSAIEKQLQASGTLKFCRDHGFPVVPLRPADPKSV